MGGVWTFSGRTQSQPSQLPEFIDPVSTLWSVKKYCYLIICQVFITLHHSYFQIYTYFLTTGWCETLSKLKKSHSDHARAWNVEVQPSVLCSKHWLFMLGHPIFHKSKGHVFMFAYFIITYSNDYYNVSSQQWPVSSFSLLVMRINKLIAKRKLLVFVSNKKWFLRFWKKAQRCHHRHL